ncbi:hypothetical protein CASFOL_000250 [Castilleja foliolosa]|uniref:glucan endo-1,3-beta-D-glucosidase n=1 Tax=Castilleja foliolosa TaxID=1961234 RepID=A0ABD3ERY7_9LAMI
MASKKTLLLLLLFLISVASSFFTAAYGGGLAINYGQIANNLPDPQSVVPLIKSIHAARLRLYDADKRVLSAFANTNVELTVGIGNEYLDQLRDPSKALDWVNSNVKCYLPATKITTISVGNEALTSNDTAFSPSNLLPAMESIHQALVSLKLDKQVMVTTAHNFGVLEVSYPPSAGKFRGDLGQAMTGILDFHCKTGSPFMINAYPFFAYRGEPNRISLKFVLFQGDGFVDTGSNLKYDNMFLAQIDAAHSAMEKLGYKNVCLQVAETGWPSAGDRDEAGATPDNARTYNLNLLKLIGSKKGTPMRPNLDLNVYIFALFNENQKQGPASERNFGLFYPNMTAVYDLGFTKTGSGGSSGGKSPPFSPAILSPSGGYFPIDDAERLNSGGALLLLLCLQISFFLALQV